MSRAERDPLHVVVVSQAWRVGRTSASRMTTRARPGGGDMIACQRDVCVCVALCVCVDVWMCGCLVGMMVGMITRVGGEKKRP